MRSRTSRCCNAPCDYLTVRASTQSQGYKQHKTVRSVLLVLSNKRVLIPWYLPLDFSMAEALLKGLL